MFCVRLPLLGLALLIGTAGCDGGGSPDGGGPADPAGDAAGDVGADPRPDQNADAADADGPVPIDATDAADLPDAPPAATLESFCRGVNERLCSGLRSCGCRFDLRPYDVGTCAAARTETCLAALEPRVGPDLAAGRARVDPAALERCLAEVSQVANGCTLGPSQDLPPSCGRVIIDSAAEGDDCSVQGGGLAFCAGGSGLCQPRDAGDPLCVPLPPADQPCLAGFCAQGLVCDADACRSPGQEQDPCVTSNGCQEPRVCSVDGVCASPGQVGDPCAEARQCLIGLACQQGTCADVPLGGPCEGSAACGNLRACGRAPENRLCGAPVGTGGTCTEGACEATLVCDLTAGQCVARPGEGQTCVNGRACAAGFGCLDGQGTCSALPGQGQTCFTGGRFCQDGLGCDFGDNTCQPPPAAGEECLINPPDYLCADGLGCDFGASGSVCIAVGGAGSACTNDRTCGSGTYCDFNQNRCADRLAAGAPCPNGNECGADLECVPSPTGFVCAAVPGDAQPCVERCTGGLTCNGPGGQCVPDLCVLP